MQRLIICAVAVTAGCASVTEADAQLVLRRNWLGRPTEIIVGNQLVHLDRDGSVNQVIPLGSSLGVAGADVVPAPLTAPAPLVLQAGINPAVAGGCPAPPPRIMTYQPPPIQIAIPQPAPAPQMMQVPVCPQQQAAYPQVQAMAPVPHPQMMVAPQTVPIRLDVQVVRPQGIPTKAVPQKP